MYFTRLKELNWKVYNELAWTENILAGPESYKDEAMTYIKAIKRYISILSPTMLHFGCGAGGHDFHFKKHFEVSGVDLSDGMLNLAKMRNPEVKYINGDMRTVDLKKKFDIVIIPDSIAYMTTFEDLLVAMENAVSHINPKGVILIVAHMKEDFMNNNFVYTGTDNNTHITVFDNNHIISESTYEATMIYLIWANSEKTIYHETHTLGLFTYDQWMNIFTKCGLIMDEMNLNDLYDKYLLDKGEYKLKLFVGTSFLQNRG